MYKNSKNLIWIMLTLKLYVNGKEVFQIVPKYSNETYIGPN